MKSQIPIHDRENNQESEDFLRDAAQRLKECNMKVLRVFYKGERLTTKLAAIQDIPSLPRRIKDLRVAGFDIQEESIMKPNGRLSHKVWFMNITKRPTKEQVLEAFAKGKLVQGKFL